MTLTSSTGNWSMLSQNFSQSELPTGIDLLWARFGLLGGRLQHRTSRYMALASRVLDLQKEIETYTDAALKDRTKQLQAIFRRGRDTLEVRLEAVGIVREVARRLRNEHPYKVQVAGAIAMLEGNIIEMATGEGKTLTASLTGTLYGWRGRGCHIITVNDYLAERDADSMRAIYEFCGLTVGFVTGAMEPQQRRAAYQCDITYLTNKEVTADFLRDQLAMGRQRGLSESLLKKIMDGAGTNTDQLVQRGLGAAIVDEADSVLIDEAVTPLIISGDGGNKLEAETYVEACKIASEFTPTEDYRKNDQYREIELTRAGENRLAKMIEAAQGVWAGFRRSEELVVGALVAREFYENGKQYIIDDDKVVIVDEATGRLMPDREWRDGLHQAVTAWENLEVQPPKDTFARMSFQRYFRLYPTLCGMTGTAREAAGELWDIYRRAVVKIPTNKPCIRKTLPQLTYRTQSAKIAAITEIVQQYHDEAKPVLAGTRSVKASNVLAAGLDDIALGNYQLLNAVNHKAEAEIIAQAGQSAAITVATNMAGRGTDIKLARGVADIGGLRVLLTERHESKRVDRQLQGRCARQGDPGETLSFASLDDELLIRHAPWLRNLLAMLSKFPTRSPERQAKPISGPLLWLVNLTFKYAQRRATQKAFSQRKGVLKTDTWLDEMLGFSGKQT
ncbi:MAG: hypothetical protein KAR11_03365 [Phycisphaerae bacterium]|nr:hypothetical protein [Phycisphaerae bacterium]